MWEPFLDEYDMSRRIKVYSYAELRHRWQQDEDLRDELDEYAVVVIDEAHNLRNPAAQQTEVVGSLLSGRNPKKVVLLTATPVNNSLFDLHTLIRLFIGNDAEFATSGIRSIHAYIKDAQDRDPDTLSPENLFDLIDKVMVRRTRKFIRAEYQGEKIPMPDGTQETIRFPEPVLHRLDYELGDAGTELVEAMVYALDQGEDELRYDERKHDEGHPHQHPPRRRDSVLRNAGGKGRQHRQPREPQPPVHQRRRPPHIQSQRLSLQWGRGRGTRRGQKTARTLQHGKQAL